MSLDQEKIKVRTRLLSNRGIGKSYHHVSLSDYGTKNSEALLNSLLSYSGEEIAGGIGYSLFGDGIEAYELSMLLARGLILRELPLYCFDFTDLVTLESGLIENLAELKTPPIFITNYKADSHDCDIKSYRILESFLSKKYIDQGIPLYIHFPYEWSGTEYTKYGDIISKNFFERVVIRSKHFEVHG
jgi:hypothetical protein